MELWKWVCIKACLEEFSEIPFGRPNLETTLGTTWSWFSVSHCKKAWVFTGCQAECGAQTCVLCGEITWIHKKPEIQMDDPTPGYRQGYRIKQVTTGNFSGVARNRLWIEAIKRGQPAFQKRDCFFECQSPSFISNHIWKKSSRINRASSKGKRNKLSLCCNVNSPSSPPSMALNFVVIQLGLIVLDLPGSVISTEMHWQIFKQS